MTVVERAGEAIARATTRRGFLQRSAVSLFGMAASASVADFLPGRAPANACQETWQGYSCGQLYPLCHSSECSAGDCNLTYCTYNLANHGSTGCWCQQEACYQCGTCTAYCGHYKCCDCKCGAEQRLCTCSGFIKTCIQTGPQGPDCIPVCC
jgi:hypothetical protein